MAEEIWRDIPGYENLYKVSNTGKVVRKVGYNCYVERVLRQEELKGYLRVTLCQKNKTKRFFVHRLVAMVFIPNPDKFTQINHKDENPFNNSVENLEWCTIKYNQNYGTINLRRAETEKKTKALMKQMNLKYGNNKDLIKNNCLTIKTLQKCLQDVAQP